MTNRMSAWPYGRCELADDAPCNPFDCCEVCPVPNAGRYADGPPLAARLKELEDKIAYWTECEQKHKRPFSDRYSAEVIASQAKEIDRLSARCTDALKELAEVKVTDEPVDYPRILYVCEHCQENAPEMCGRARDDLYVTPSGQWLCDECRDEEGVPISDCVSPPALYPASTVARLQQEIQRLKDAELADAKAGLRALGQEV